MKENSNLGKADSVLVAAMIEEESSPVRRDQGVLVRLVGAKSVFAASVARKLKERLFEKQQLEVEVGFVDEDLLPLPLPPPPYVVVLSMA